MTITSQVPPDFFYSHAPFRRYSRRSTDNDSRSSQSTSTHRENDPEENPIPAGGQSAVSYVSQITRRARWEFLKNHTVSKVCRAKRA